MLDTKTKLKILDFDCETRPLSFRGDYRPTAEITALAMCWADDQSSLRAYLLGDTDTVSLLKAFVKRYNEADIVTAHNVRGFDLSIINAALIEFGLPILTPKLAIDTYLDFKKRRDIPISQEFLLDLFEIGKKEYMGQHAWREANRLTPKGLDKTYKRVTGDVLDHMALRLELVRRNLLHPPKMWYP